MNGGDKADANRLFQEAIASYVGHRAATYWQSIETTQNMAFQLKKHEDQPAYQRADHAELRRVPKKYDAAMSARVFGFQSKCSICAQNNTSRIISGEMKRFADVTLLENKIPEQFSSTGSIFEKWKGLGHSYQVP